MPKVCKEKLDKINLLVDNALDETGANELKEHFAVCDSCKRYYEEIKYIKNSLSKIEFNIPADINKQILSKIQKKSQKPKTVSFYKYATLTAASVILILGVLLIGRFDNNIIRDSVEVYNGGGAEKEKVESILPPKENTDLDNEMKRANVVSFNVDNKSNTMMDQENLVEKFKNKQDILYKTDKYKLDGIKNILKEKFSLENIEIEKNTVVVNIKKSQIGKIEDLFEVVLSEKENIKGDTLKIRIISFYR